MGLGYTEKKDQSCSNLYYSLQFECIHRHRHGYGYGYGYVPLICVFSHLGYRNSKPNDAWCATLCRTRMIYKILAAS